MSIKVIKTIEELKKIEPLWNEMTAQSDYKEPYFSWFWFDRWWNCFGKDKELFIIVAQDSKGQISAIAPFMRSRKRLRGFFLLQEISFINDGTGPRNSILHRNDKSGEKSVTEIIEYLANNQNDWDLIYLNDIERNRSFLDKFYYSAKIHRLKIIQTNGKKAPFLRIEKKFQTYFAEKFNAKGRYNIKKRLKECQKKGEYKVCFFKDYNEMKIAINFAFKVSKSSWKAENRTDMVSSEARKYFYDTITNYFAQKNQVIICIAMLDGEPIALQYQMVQDGIIYLLINDFDQKYSKLGPGTTLMYSVLDKYHTDGDIKEFDFCGGEIDYKLKWAQGLKEHVTIQLFSSKIISFSYFIFFCKQFILPYYRMLRHKINFRCLIQRK